ncbi:MAG: DNA polymerase III subunit [Oscillospiraceae bacterium]|jgi:DNA polymerase-3 subunit delta'|nr:DNA polymerase III subunit [Oscillospiraceae bacterium]
MFEQYFAGNPEAKSELLEKSSARLPHAVLIYGETGLGKKTFAGLVACRYIMGEEKFFSGGNPFDTRESRLVLNKLHPDLYIQDGGESIKVDDVRKIASELYIRPNQAARKVYVLADCQNMTVQAQNALLKSLEEPPQTAAFILTAESKSRLLETIISRVRSVRLFPVKPDEGLGYIKKILPEADIPEAGNFLRTFGGNIGKTLAALDKSEKSPAYQIFGELSNAIESGDIYGAALALTKASAKRPVFKEVCDLLSRFMGELLAAKARAESPRGALAAKLEYRRIVRIVSFLDEIRQRDVYNLNLPLMSARLALCVLGNRMC